MLWNNLLKLKLKHFKHVPDFILDKMNLSDTNRVIAYFLKNCLNAGRDDHLWSVKCFGSGLGWCQLKGKRPQEGFRVSVNVCCECGDTVSKGLHILSLDESVIQSMNEIHDLWSEQLEILNDHELGNFGFEQISHGVWVNGELLLKAFKGYWIVALKQKEICPGEPCVVLTDEPVQALLNYVSSHSNLFMGLNDELRDRFIKKDFKDCKVVLMKEFEAFVMENHIPISVVRSLHGKIEDISVWEVIKSVFAA